MAELELTDEDRERIAQMRKEHLGYVLYDDEELAQVIREEEERKNRPLIVVPERRRLSGSDIVRTYWTEERVDGRRVFRRATEENGILVSSLTENELHAPVFDLDFEVLQDGQKIVFYSRHLRSEYWDRVLKEFVDAGLIEHVWGKLTMGHVMFSVPFELRNSSTAGHFHLLLRQEIDWSQYLKILAAMTEAGLIEPGYFSLCSEAQMGLLLKPTLKKQEMPRSYTGYGRSSRMSDY